MNIYFINIIVIIITLLPIMIHSDVGPEVSGNCISGNCKNGQGTMIFPSMDNCKYVGEFKDGLTYGKGVLIYSEGEKEEGMFHPWLELIKGNIYKNGKIVNVVHRLFSITTEDNGKCVSGNCEKGIGRWVSSSYSGTEYSGNFKDCVPHGTGEYKDIDGRYVGNWKEGLKHGKGILYGNDGSKKEGIWEYNQLVKNKQNINEDDNTSKNELSIADDSVKMNSDYEKIPSISDITQTTIISGQKVINLMKRRGEEYYIGNIFENAFYNDIEYQYLNSDSRNYVKGFYNEFEEKKIMPIYQYIRKNYSKYLYYINDSMCCDNGVFNHIKYDFIKKGYPIKYIYHNGDLYDVKGYDVEVKYARMVIKNEILVEVSEKTAEIIKNDTKVRWSIIYKINNVVDVKNTEGWMISKSRIFIIEPISWIVYKKDPQKIIAQYNWKGDKYNLDDVTD